MTGLHSRNNAATSFDNTYILKTEGPPPSIMSVRGIS